jgi:lysine 2,3-aminomutase
MEHITENVPPLIEKANIGEVLQYLQEKFNISEEKMAEIEAVNEIYPMKVNSYYMGLIDHVDDPIWKQCIPSIEELKDQTGEEDPLAEERDSPAPLITHRYPDRVLFLISDTCEMYCRFCTRKRKVGTEHLQVTYEKMEKAIAYIAAHPEVRDVILSGGDALCISNERLEYVLSRVRAIEHVEIIRLGTRVPCTNPSRITPELCDMLKKYHPLYMNIHFENPQEITPEARRAVAMLADAGIPLGNQNVLLKGINDDVPTMAKLYKELLKMRVKPYYLFQADYVKGTNHFRTPVKTGLDIIYGIRGWVSGLAIPHYVIDAPDGGGKIPLIPDYTEKIGEDAVIMHNFRGKECHYPQVKN